MKRYIFWLALAFASCRNSSPSRQAIAITGMKPGAMAIPAADVIIDPVCGMVKDSTWTDYTLYKGDTVWFCASKEKTAFEANPRKYEKNIVTH